MLHQRWRWLFSIALLSTLVFNSSAWASEAEVRTAIDAYVSAFNKQDAAALSAMWEKDGIHIDRETGERTVGADSIAKDVKTAFESNDGLVLAVNVDHIRLIKPDVASVDGQTVLRSSESSPSLSTFAAILVKHEQGWRIFSIDESPLRLPASASEALAELDWLVGKWSDESEDVRIVATVSWSTNKTFLLRSYVVSPKEGEPQSGTQIIGWDARSQQIRSWVFLSDGTFGNGVWSKNDGDWLIKSSQTLADGRVASGTYVLTPIDRDTISMKLIGHEIEGEPQPSTGAVISQRVEVKASDKNKGGAE